MTDRAYIVRRTLENKIAIAENNNQNPLLVTLDVLKEITTMLKEQEAVVRCKECTHWKPAHIKLNDGRQRLYREGEKDAGPLGMGVSNDIGINIGARCWVDHNTGYGRDMRVFRGENDFCSRAIKLPEGMTPEKWWGLSTEPKALRDD